jgi:hypothetical protein
MTPCAPPEVKLVIVQSRRFFVALPIVLSALVVAVPDAMMIQRNMPRDRIWLLVLYAVAPALLAAGTLLTIRSGTKSLLIAVSALGPPIVRFAVGPHTADAAFDRLSLNPLWFAVHWLPIACAIIVVLQTDASLPRPLAFRRRFWRFGVALLLLFIAATFTSKLSLEMNNGLFMDALSFDALFIGIVLVVSDLPPPRAGRVILFWGWLALLFFSLLATTGAGMQLDRKVRERSMIRSHVVGTQGTLAAMRAAAKRYESRGKLTAADRIMIQGELNELEAELHSYETAQAQPPLRVVYTTFILALSLGMSLLFALLFRQAWRDRRAPRTIVVQEAEG